MLVAELNPEFTQLLYGAREAYASRHTDYVRHFVTSYRELFTRILHELAPDAEVMKWTTDSSHFKDKRPTWKGRLLYITRDLGPMFGGFLDANVDAVLAFVDLFQKGTHAIKPDFTDDQLLDLVRRAEGLLRFMLTVRRVTVLGKV